MSVFAACPVGSDPTAPLAGQSSIASPCFLTPSTAAVGTRKEGGGWRRRVKVAAVGAREGREGEGESHRWREQGLKPAAVAVLLHHSGGPNGYLPVDPTRTH